MAERGHISIHTENILPIIKKWLYSEKEIFLRELVANAADALTKLEKLSLLGEVTRDVPEPRIALHIDKEKKTLTITDTGIGLTADEIKKYINQVAFSGVKDFLEKYQDKGGEEQVIGHFGLGFYSAFMVADRVEIDTLSYQEGATAAHWSCDGSTEFELTPSSRQEVGTTITLHVNEESQEVLDPFHLREILQKYCAFIRFPIYLDAEQVNEPRPLWTKNPSELKDEDYLGFFRKLFPTASDPLFWIHLNVDYPFKLRGILFFPKLKHELDASQGEVKLYCNQVFVADNPKELLPDYLILLKGAVDCPDLPLNVSRSYLQNDPQARKIKEHIAKKVADKLAGLAKTEREQYEKFWEDISPFVKYGMMRDQKFFERMQEHLLFKTTTDQFVTLDQYLEKNKDKTDNKVVYATDMALQASKIHLLKENDIDVVVTEGVIDQHFLPYLEMQSGRKYHFQRIDAGILSALKDHQASTILDPNDQKTKEQKVLDIFTKFLDVKGVQVKAEGLKSEKLPAVLTVDENVRRMKEMARMNPMFSQFDQAPLDSTLIVNVNSQAVKRLLDVAGGLSIDDAALKTMVHQIYDLAYLQHNKFTPEAMQAFIERSASILSGFK